MYHTRECILGLRQVLVLFTLSLLLQSGATVFEVEETQEMRIATSDVTDVFCSVTIMNN